ncbi:MAG: thiamine pyrophosphate-binding protein [Kiritimatiellae bacterium]|nr:thiamine pyrophosphate-binding protein [Kiritimatiellia bacterium]
MRVADYIWKTLADWGTDHVFLVTGGGAMHLNDALGQETRIKYVCNLHEQACAMAAEGYARISGKPGVVNVTTGPGGTNALTGVMGAWLDSVPMVVISGQTKRATMITAAPELKLRSLGDQEYNIVDSVKPMTKYAKIVMSAEEVPQALSDAWRICQEGRPGPVWIDVPLDIQAAPCDFPPCTPPVPPPVTIPILSAQIEQVVDLLRNAKRPAMIVGSGVRNAKAEEIFLSFAESLNIPVLTSISGIDLIPSDHPLFFGRPGILGERPANLIMQNSDLFLVVGTRMGIRICGYAYDTVAREATKIMVDVDLNELNKPTFRPDIKINADACEFMRAVNALLPSLPAQEDWLSYCRRMKAKYPVVLSEHRKRTDYVSSYVLPGKIMQYVSDPVTLVTSNGIAYTSTFQAIPIRKGMRMFSNEACASMGYGLPAAIGAWFGTLAAQPSTSHSPLPTLICMEGDGSIQMNLQELQTLLTYRVPMKLFIYNNDGYLSIKTTQKAFFGGKFVGAEPTSGVILPSFEKLAAAYGIPYFRLVNNQELDTKLPKVFGTQGPVLVEVMLDPFEVLGPKAASKRLPDGRMVSAPLEDMFPFLPRDEFRENMIIKPLDVTF